MVKFNQHWRSISSNYRQLFSFCWFIKKRNSNRMKHQLNEKLYTCVTVLHTTLYIGILTARQVRTRTCTLTLQNDDMIHVNVNLIRLKAAVWSQGSSHLICSKRTNTRKTTVCVARIALEQEKSIAFAFSSQSILCREVNVYCAFVFN